MNENRKLGLVVEGGAMRGIFACGVLDALLENNYNPFHYGVGVSAGSTNLAAYLAKMHRRNYQVYTTFSLDKKFINPMRGLIGGHMMDLDWLWKVTIKHMRLDLQQIVQGPTQYQVGVTEAKKGRAVILTPKVENLEDVIKASSALPIFYKHPVRLEGVEYYDGGIANPIPVQAALEAGCQHIVVIRSRKSDFIMKPSKNPIMGLLLKQYPGVVEATNRRNEIYNQQIDLLRNTTGDQVIIDEINTPENFETGRLTKDLKILNKDYELGLMEGRKLMDRLMLTGYKNLW